jgi:hypothetical protein
MDSGRDKEKAAIFAFAICVSALSGPAVAQQAVDVTITNNGFEDMRIEVADGICGGDLFAGVLVRNAVITVNPCAGQDRTAVILIANSVSGAINRYDGLQSGTNIRLR